MWTASGLHVGQGVSLQCPPVLSRNKGLPSKGQNWEVNLVLTHDPEPSNPPGLELEGFMASSLPRPQV